MKPQALFSSRIGDRWTFAVEFEGLDIGIQTGAWNECWGTLWLWVEGRVVGRPSELEMVMTGFDSLMESAQVKNLTSPLLSSLPANEALDLVLWACYGDDDPPKNFAGDRALLSRHEILPRLTCSFFDDWSAILIQEDCRERFIYREKEGPVSEASWPIGTFTSIVLQARDRFQQFASALLRAPLQPPGSQRQ